MKRLVKWMLPLLLLGLGTAGCEQQERFKVPEHIKKKPQKVVLYKVKSPARLPRIRLVWTDMTNKRVGLLRPEIVSLQGQTWSREGQAKLYEFYFRRNNYLRAYDVLPYANSIPAFLSQMAGVPFKGRLNVMLAPFPPPKAGQKPPALPSLPGETIRIFSGTNTEPAWTRFGMIRRLIQLTAAMLFSGSAKENPKKFWTSMALPYYVAFRGKSALSDKSYNRTSRPSFTALLKKSGFPSAREIQRAIGWMQQGKKLNVDVKEHWLTLVTSFFGFLEDAYGQRALIGSLQHHLKKKRPDAQFLRSVEEVIGTKATTLWKQWEVYYNPQSWKNSN